MEINRQSAISKIIFFSSENIPFLFLIDFTGNNWVVEPLDNIDSDEIKFWINGKTNDHSIRTEGPDIVLEKYPMDFAQYKAGFDYVRQQIIHGNSFLVNLTAETPIALNISLEEVFKRSEAKYKLWWKDHFVCFSPEIFVKIDESGLMSSFPMKGTIDAGLLNAGEILLSDRKELYEHTTIVDLIRNDLSRVAEKVWVEQFRYIDKIETHNRSELLQVSSQICAKLNSQWHEQPGEILAALLPAGSITGAPKTKTVEIIRAAEKLTYQEGSQRGYYTGVFGIFDGKSVDSGVMIRYIEQKKDGSLTFKSGGGITANSIAEKEYEELIQKIYVPIVRNHSITKPETPQPCLP
ncbi:aminodeoxychorismate synthase component I [Emticicia sp. 21SJ11W-3]|uniref:aminodeoxychorismate synthase component I n=1 Tax=Emticicia sp. 21SJ11W-3 TaxID=2916755 RepID=UPI0020A1590C|nr:aminodeoxychorismate synthase component I [Emticicia sp. 21SJ11W-3]UTA70039.1 aminodeoxychorismate synthase component I [Emticicia sp. 21SJ11W-3]